MLVCPYRKCHRHPEGGTTEGSPEDQPAPKTKGDSVVYSRGFPPAGRAGPPAYAFGQASYFVVGMTKKEKVVPLSK